MASTAKNSKTPIRLVPEYSVFAKNDIGDMLAVLMANVEAGLILAGATPNKDYTYRDLVNWAIPMLHTMFEKSLVGWSIPSENTSVSYEFAKEKTSFVGTSQS